MNFFGWKWFFGQPWLMQINYESASRAYMSSKLNGCTLENSERFLLQIFKLLLCDCSCRRTATSISSATWSATWTAHSTVRLLQPVQCTVKVFMLLQCKSKHGRELFPSSTARSDSDIRWAILTKIKMALPQIFHIYTGPKLTQIPDLHGTQIYTNLDLHGTHISTNLDLHGPHISTAQVYTNPFSHIDSKKPKFTQKFFFKFCLNYIKWIPLSTLVSSKKTMPL